MEPIKSSQEAAQSQEYVIAQTMNKLGISREQAEKRLFALLNSHLMKWNPNHITTKMAIDKFMATPIN